MSEIDFDNLPQGWLAEKLSNVTLKVPNVRPEYEPDRVFHYVDISSIDNSTFQIIDTRQFVGIDAPSRARRPIQKGDVLFSNVRTYLRNIAVVPNNLDGQIASTGFTILRPTPAVLTAYLYFWMLTDEFIDTVTPQQTGSSYPATTDRIVRDQLIPLPPLAEQERIVAKVEMLLARTWSVRQHLTSAHDILKQFRQAVLANACSGTLTEDWRAITVNSANETGYLPPNWQQRPLKDLCTSFDYGSSQKSHAQGQVPVLRMGNLQNGRIDWSDLKYSSDAAEIEKYLLTPNTVLFNRTNSPELVGKTSIYVGERPAIFAGYLIRLVHGPDIDPEYLNFCLNEQTFREYCMSVKSDGVSQSNINAKKLAAYEIPLPSLIEQREIVYRANALFTLANTIEQQITAAAKRTEAVTQRILARAFRGQLVPTESNLAVVEGREYEAADQLIARVNVDLANQKPITRHTLSSTSTNRLHLKQRVEATVKRSIIDVLGEALSGMTPEELFQKSGCGPEDVDNFYEQLRTGVASGDIIQQPAVPDSKNPKVLLIIRKR